jgi:hypothetical protein
MLTCFILKVNHRVLAAKHPGSAIRTHKGYSMMRPSGNPRRQKTGFQFKRFRSGDGLGGLSIPNVTEEGSRLCRLQFVVDNALLISWCFGQRETFSVHQMSGPSVRPLPPCRINEDSLFSLFRVAPNQSTEFTFYWNRLSNPR